MNKSPLNISGPYTHKNLAIFLFHDPGHLDSSHYVPLRDAMQKKHVVVYETGSVGELEVENLSDIFDIFVQAGDVLKGGRQDRTIAIDFIVPAKSGRLPIPAFCVESGRWQRRKTESQRFFSCSTNALHAKSARLAAKLKRSQSAVWEGVAACQEDLGASLGKSVHAADSPTSYQLSVEDRDLQKRKRDYETKLRRIVEERSDVVGYAFYVNGRRNSADIYASTKLFHMLWKKLLDVAILEAISASNGAPAVTDHSNAQAWLSESAEAKMRDNRSAAPRTRLATKEYQTGTVFETFDEAVNDRVILHTSIISH
jgi:ARG/rhodanese/phosphatase superfamily protein